ncbi:hypothetical protein [Croceitalea rosinachiae]|uniref:Uncharacterized protein n=1 Tax=Croceitalea rosinachiae TaxID=3075596 RepID=A0ABU3A6V8_9FLAO|nr:hypothetical protein [Croceitalea sp. F388]MDT0605918.1 hypothetical protein [Croceitalea sp. F388]
MENSRLKGRILMEIEKIIARSSAKGKMTKKVQDFHEAIIKKYYNASDAKIDYHRHRVKMNIIVDDTAYDPKTANINLKTLHTNLFFKNLHMFLRSCIEKDTKSLAFYAKLIRDFSSRGNYQLASY